MSDAISVEEKKGSGGCSGKTIVIALVVLVFLCVCCVVSIFGALTLTIGAGINALSQVTTEALCSGTTADYQVIYQDLTTARFRSNVTEAEFEALMLDLRSVCGELEGLDAIGAMTKGLNISFKEDISGSSLVLSGNFSGKQVYLEMVEEMGDLKIDVLRIN
ncbi:MAG: hypothetical protein UZ20_WS6002001129 [candidate division WS6 bacterium OLB21]|uniref:Uncharacterized protein n=1 Tax=candidate division WS6 bacterium OLB21 TaxID=1617427 RepID=A0A136KEJ0_9BACT|nr:MAG: hypothetical protein UZ20_WS6002001129 [candidate division WS6 bacterium OLB21]